MKAITITIPDLTTAGFIELCQLNKDLAIEREATGEVVIMPPTLDWTGKQNSSLNALLWQWNDRTNKGIVFDSSTGFTLANGAVRSPDVSWISTQKWDSLSESQKKGQFSHIAPDFIIELRSTSDNLTKLQQKMVEYIDNGVVLAWLIDSENKTVEIYRPGKEVELLQDPGTISGENVLPGFVLDLNKIW